MLKSEFEFPLVEEIEYRVGGDTKKAQTIVLKAPCYNDTKKVLKLHGLINNGMRDFVLDLLKQNSKDKKNNSEDASASSSFSSDDIITALMSGKCDTDSIIDIFTSLLLKSARLDGETALTAFHLDKLSPQTILKLLGEYVVNFPLAV